MSGQAMRPADVALDTRAELPAPHPPPDTLDLSYFERRAVAGLVSKNGDEMETYAAQAAAAYASGDAAVRHRALGRAAAVQEALVQETSALLSAAIARVDTRAVRLLDPVLTSATARLRGLLEQLRIESGRSRRIAVLAKGSVAITAEERL